MSDLHTRIAAAIDRAEQVARDVIDAIGDSPWVVEYLPTTQRITNARAYVIAETHVGSPLPGNRALWAPEPEHIALNDPAAVLRRCAADRRVLERHQHYTIPAGYDGAGMPNCNRCNGYEWPCDEIEDLADRYGIEVQA